MLQHRATPNLLSEKACKIINDKKALSDSNQFRSKVQNTKKVIIKKVKCSKK